MNKEIDFKRFDLISGLSVFNDMFHVIDTERDRLSPWFWWMSKKITPNKIKCIIFMILYLADTKRKEIMHKIDNKNEYDEQFLIMVDGKFGGMTGLDNINDITKCAEMWRFVSKENEGIGVGSASIKFLEKYCLEDKKLQKLYAKVNIQNTRSIQCVERNGFKLKSIKYGVRTSKRNPQIADIITWEKQLVK